MKALLCTVLIFLPGCLTIVQHPVQSKIVSYDGDEQNSGVIATTLIGYKVTSHFRDRYNALIEIYGNAKLEDKSPIFTPNLTKDVGLTANSDGSYKMTKQAMMWMVQMSEMQHRGFKPSI
jgi:hypothetical protein